MIIQLDIYKNSKKKKFKKGKYKCKNTFPFHQISCTFIEYNAFLNNEIVFFYLQRKN